MYVVFFNEVLVIPLENKKNVSWKKQLSTGVGILRGGRGVHESL